MAFPSLLTISRFRLYIFLALFSLLLTTSYFSLDPSDVRQVASSLSSQYRTGNIDEQPSCKPPTNGECPEAISDEYVAICIAIKDQRADLPEWLAHHYHHIGIRRFYLMDDGSIPPLSETTNYGIPNSAITFRYFSHTEHIKDMQYLIYNKCIEDYGNNHSWMAFIDADEFLEMTSTKSLRDLLTELDDDPMIGALGINWKMHSSSGLITRPVSARQSFVKCIWDELHPEDGTLDSDNKHIKSIVKTTLYDKPINPHKFFLKAGAVTVGENRDVIEHPAFRSITRDWITLHHYAVKSKAEYQEKITRSNGMDIAKDWGWWDHVEGLPQLDCSEMARFEP